MGRFGNSWQTVKASWAVLKQDKELLLFPVLSGLASLVVIASFVAPTWFSGLIERGVDQDDSNAQATLAIVYLAMYMVLSFVTIYFTSALVFAANERLAGGDPTIGSGLRGANQRLGKILLWSLFAATVSLLIHLLERAMRQRGQLVGRIVFSIVGTAWALATYFAIPVLLFENEGVFGSLRRSGHLFKQRWGESLIGNYGIGAVFGLLGFLVVLATLGLVYFLIGSGSFIGVPFALAILFAGALVFALITVVGQALGSVYKVALYRYAREGAVPATFQPQIIQGAYRPAGGSGPRAHW